MVPLGSRPPDQPVLRRAPARPYHCDLGVGGGRAVRLHKFDITGGGAGAMGWRPNRSRRGREYRRRESTRIRRETVTLAGTRAAMRLRQTECRTRRRPPDGPIPREISAFSSPLHKPVYAGADHSSSTPPRPGHAWLERLGSSSLKTPSREWSAGSDRSSHRSSSRSRLLVAPGRLNRVEWRAPPPDPILAVQFDHWRQDQRDLPGPVETPRPWTGW